MVCMQNKAHSPPEFEFYTGKIAGWWRCPGGVAVASSSFQLIRLEQVEVEPELVNIFSFFTRNLPYNFFS